MYLTLSYSIYKNATLLLIVIFLNLTVIVMSRSFTKKKDKFATEIGNVQDKFYPSPKNFTQTCL